MENALAIKSLPENSLAVANYFINKANEEGVELTQMKLIKLVYIAHGWHLALKGEPLIDEGAQAWKYGPVIPSIYHAFKHYGNNQISQPGYIFTVDGLITPAIKDKSKIDFLNKVWDVYKDYNGLQLSTLTHQKNTPWDIIWNQNGGNKNDSQPISNKLIQDHYKTKVKTKP